MLEITYCNINNIINTLAESLVIGGFPMNPSLIRPGTLANEIHFIDTYLRYIWINQDRFTLVKEDENAKTGVLRTRDTGQRAEEIYKPLLKYYEAGKFDGDMYIKRGMTLGNVKSGSGHNSLFKGVTFNIAMNMPLYWLKEYQRYHFTDIISSQSTMHRISKMDMKEHCVSEVDEMVIDVINLLINRYNEEQDADTKKELWRTIIASCPSGLILGQGITMNYLQAISMVNQRKNHKLSEWSEDFVPFLRSLPFFELFLEGSWD